MGSLSSQRNKDNNDVKNVNDDDDIMNDEFVHDVIIIGGGVVGLSILHSATKAGLHCVLVEGQPDLVSDASGSNSGIACTGVDATPGTLERALIRDSISQLRPHCQLYNIPTRPCGSLVCLWPWDLDSDSNSPASSSSSSSTAITTKLSQVLAESHDAGDTHAKIISGQDVLKQFEPNINPQCQGAVHIPGEVVVDPWLFSINYAVQARANGAKIYTNFYVDATQSKFSNENNTWTIVSQSPTKWTVHGKVVVNATGIMADTIQQQLLHEPKTPWIAKPRRGQYRVYYSSNLSPSTSSSSTFITHPIQPVPTQVTKGIFVFSTLYNQIVVGPTALDQESRTDRSIDPIVSQQLDEHAQKIIPNLSPLQNRNVIIGDYVGIRPGTNQRDYQIHIRHDKQWISVAGIRSTGLTASLGIGNYVCRQLTSLLTSSSLSSFSSSSSNDNNNINHTNYNKKQTPIKTVVCPLPSLKEMVAEFNGLSSNNNSVTNKKSKGYVTIHGFSYKVTHPITIFGWQAQTGLANLQTNSKSGPALPTSKL